MKIYNKKGFAFGLFMVILGILSLFFNGDVLIINIPLFYFGIVQIVRSLSQKLSKEDKMEKLDERNQLIKLKSKSKSFVFTQIISFLFMLMFLAVGKVTSNENFISIGVGLSFAFVISMFTEVFTFLYYESST